MAGGLLQIVAYGLHDTMLTGNPQISFFKIVYRKHTKFYIESIEQSYTGDLTPNNKISVTLSKQGDLLTNLYFEMKQTTYDTFSCIDYVECLIGDTLIDRHYGHWMNLWNDLTTTDDKQLILDIMRRGSIEYSIPEIRDDYNPLFTPPLTSNEVRKYPFTNDFSIRNMYMYDIFIFIVRSTGLDNESWISRLTVSSLLTAAAEQTINGAFTEKFIKAPVITVTNNITSTIGMTVHKTKLYIVDNEVGLNSTGYIDVHTLDTNSNSNTYGNITNSNLKLIGADQTNSEVNQFNRKKPYINIYGQSYEGFYIGVINAIYSTNDYILLSNNDSEGLSYLYKLYTDLGNYHYKYNILETYPKTTTLFGKDTPGYSNGLSAVCTFNNPSNIAAYEEIDSETNEYIFTNLYIVDQKNNVIRRWNRTAASLTTLAGAEPTGDNNPAEAGYQNGSLLSSKFNYPNDICLSSNGRVIIVTDTGNYRIRKIDLFTNSVTTIAGSGNSGSNNGIGINTSFNLLTSIDMSPDQTYVLVCDNSNQGCKIRKIIISTAVVSTIADNANFKSLSSISIDPLGNYALITDGEGNNIYKLDLVTNNSLNIIEGTVTLIAGAADNQAGTTNAPNGGALNARFNNPSGIKINNSGEYALISDTNNSTIRKLIINDFNNPAVLIFTGKAGIDGSDDGSPDWEPGAAGFATFNKPHGIYITNLSTSAYIVDTDNNKIREIKLANRQETISTFYIEQYTSQLDYKVNHIVTDNQNNMYIIFDQQPGLYLIMNNPNNLNTNAVIIYNSDIIAQGNSLNIKDDLIYITCSITNRVYTYNLVTYIFSEIVTDNSSLGFINPSSILVTYYNDILVSENTPTGVLKAIGVEKPYNIYHDFTDYQQVAYLPLQFWFCNSALALPLISLGNTDVKLNIKFTNNISDINLLKIWGDYIFLDESERKQFIHNPQEYLITQVQHSTTQRLSEKTVVNNNPIDIYSIIELSFSHPIKELIWTLYQTTDTENSNKKSCSILNEGGNQNIELSSMYLQFNGYDRFGEREGKYFTKVQRYKYHSGIGVQNTRRGVRSDDVTEGLVTSKWFPKTINTHIYSFSLKPEETQPSGSCDFSKLDSSTMHMKYKTSTINGKHNYDLDVYALNYNILKIENGSAALLYTI